MFLPLKQQQIHGSDPAYAAWHMCNVKFLSTSAYRQLFNPHYKMVRSLSLHPHIHKCSLQPHVHKCDISAQSGKFFHLTSSLGFAFYALHFLLSPSMALNALCTALSCLGFTNAAAVFNADQQELDSLDKFHPLMDGEVENLIKVTCHPGGSIPNPAPVVAGAPALPLIPNPGIPVSLHAENNLQFMCYFLWHMEQTSRTIIAQTITVA